MSIFSWMDSRIHKLRWFDISLIRIASFTFALMLAKLWSPLLSLEWYWYLLIAIVAAIRPVYRVFSK